MEKGNDNKQEAPIQFFSEISRADSSLYEKYTLRPYNPNVLYQKKGSYDIFDEMREDDQISALLMLKKLMIIGDWAIECEDEKIKAQIENNFKEGIDELFEKKLINILSALDYGFSLTEKIFAYEDTKEWGNKIIIKKLKTRAPHSFEFPQDEFGNITEIKQDTGSGEDILLPVKKFIHYIYKKEFDNPYGQSDIGTIGVYRAWFGKDNIIKFWNMYLEKFGSPTVVGTYPKGMANQRAQLLKVLKRIQQDTAIAIPDGFVVDLLQATTQKGEAGYEKAIDKYNTMIARPMLVPDLMGMSGGETKGGSFALGKEHFGLFYELINTEKKQLARLVNRELVSPLVLWNYGNQYNAEFKFIAVDDKKKEAQFKIWLEAIKTGKLQTTTEQLNHFLKGIDFPELTEEDIRKKEEEDNQKREDDKEKWKNKFQPGFQPQPGEPEQKPEQKLPEKPIEKKQTKEYAKTKYDRRVNYAKIERETENIEKKYKDDLAQLFKLSINGLADSIRRQKIIERKRFDLIEKLTLKHTVKIEKMIKDMMKDGMVLGSETAKEEIPQKYYIINPVPELSDDEVAEWLTEHASYVSSMESGFILGKAKPILAESIRNGTSTKQAMTMLDESLRGYDIDIEDIGGANRLENIVRTNTAKAFNEMRKQEFAKVSDHIKGYYYSIILDGRQSALCEKLDSAVNGIYQPNEVPWPPNHHMCRSLVTAVYEDEEVDKWGEMPAVEQVDGDFLKLKI